MNNPIIRVRTEEPQLADNGQFYVIAEETAMDINEDGFPQETTFTAFIKLGKDEDKAKAILPSVIKSLRTKTIVRVRTSEPTYKGQPQVMKQDENGKWTVPMGYYHTEKLRPYTGVHFQLDDKTNAVATPEVATVSASSEDEPPF